MKIAATADIHYDLIRKDETRLAFDEMVERLKAEKPDALILAGDTVGLGWELLEECLGRFRDVAPRRMIVFGNHDYWTDAGDTFEHLASLATVIADAGWHLLEHGPLLAGSVGFAGNGLWYDYSLATDGLPAATYEQKCHNGLLWNDARFVRLGKSDKEHTAELLQRLESDIESLEGKARVIVAVTHHVPFLEMARAAERKSGETYPSAFMGSAALGEMLLRHPSVKYHICGHTHVPERVERDGLVSINVGGSYREKRYVMVDIPAGE